MPHLNVELHHIAAQVDVAVLQPHFLVRKNRFAWQERWLLRFIENPQFINDQFNFAGRDIFVDRIGIALLHRADYRDHVLITQRRRFVMRYGIQFTVDDNLCHTRPVAQVNENDSA